MSKIIVLVFGLWICKFTKSLSQLKCSIHKYVNSELWFSCEIYLNVSDAYHELDYCDRIPNERNLL